jgi:hypothetical protein
MSSRDVGGPQIASIRMPVLVTSILRCSRCIARNAVRGSVLVHGGSSADPPPPVVMWVMRWMGWKRS